MSIQPDTHVDLPIPAGATSRAGWRPRTLIKLAAALVMVGTVVAFVMYQVEKLRDAADRAH
jgi:hypothetical protein